MATVQRLQRKHEGLERDLAALNDKVKELDETAKRLMNTHPDQQTSIYEHQTEINEHWNLLTGKADERKAKLLDAYDLQRFLSDYRDLQSWISSMMALVSSDELAKDVTGAEALLERHQVSRAVSRSVCYKPPRLFRAIVARVRLKPTPIAFDVIKAACTTHC